MQSDIPIDVFCEAQTATLKDRPKGCYLLSTLRIDSQDQRRVSMKLRTSEGRNGMLSVLVIPWGEKTAVSIEVPIKALNLHTRFQFNEK